MRQRMNEKFCYEISPYNNGTVGHVASHVTHSRDSFRISLPCVTHVFVTTINLVTQLTCCGHDHKTGVFMTHICRLTCLPPPSPRNKNNYNLLITPGSSNPYFSYRQLGTLKCVCNGGRICDILVTPFHYYPAISFAPRAKFCCLI